MSYSFLFLSLDGSGHTYPQLPLAAELVQRGHKVTYICSPNFREAISDIGAQWIESDPQHSTDNYNNTAVDRSEIFAHNIVKNAQSDLHAFRSISSEHFDVIAYETFSLAGPIISSMYEIAGVQLWASEVTPNLPDGSRYRQSIIRDFLAQYSIYDWMPSCTPTGNDVAFFPRFFQRDGDEYPSDFHFIGPCIGKRFNVQPWSPPNDDDHHRIFISLGTVFNKRHDFFLQCLHALADSKYQVIMAVGDKIPLAEFSYVPKNFTLAPFFPQPDVLKHTDVFVSHAGMNSCMEGLYYGTRFVLYPQSYEQGNNAQRLIDLGVGELLPEKCTPDDIHTTIDTVFASPTYRSNARHWQTQIQQCPGVSAGADVLENVAHHHTPTILHA